MNKFFSFLFYKFSRNRLVIFVLTFLLGYLAEKVLDSLFEGQELSNILSWFAALIAAPMLFLLIREFRLYLKKKFVDDLEDQAQPARKKGLIFLFSKEDTFMEAVQYHNIHLTHIWVIVTTESREKFREIPELGDHIEKPFEEHVQKAWSPSQTANAVQRIVDKAHEYGLSKEDLMCDITGCTTAMKVGAIRTCQLEELEMQMVPARYDEKLNAQVPLPPIKVEFYE